MKTVRNLFLVIGIVAVAASMVAVTSYPSSMMGKGGGGNSHPTIGWGHGQSKPSHGNPNLINPQEDVTLTPGTPTETVTDEPTGTVTTEPSETAVPTETVEPSSTVDPTETVSPSETPVPSETVEPSQTAAPTETVTETPGETLTPESPAVPNAPVINLDPTPRRGKPGCPPATMTPILKFLASARLLPARWAACIAQ